MENQTYQFTPTILETGASFTAKTHTQSKMVRPDYAEGMELMTGEGSTTSCQTETIIDPNITVAQISISLADEGELRIKLIKNLRESLVRECKNVIASLPENGNKAIEDFLERAVENRSDFTDPTFRIQYLLIHKQEEYQKLLKEIFEPVIKTTSEPEFRRNYREVSSKDKDKTQNMVEMLIDNKLNTAYIDEAALVNSSDTVSHQLCRPAIDKLIDLIITERNRILSENGFQVTNNMGRVKNLSPDKFYHVMSHLSNSTNKRPTDTESIACCINEMQLVIPGEGITVDSCKTAYKLIDIVGFDNEGNRNENVDLRINQALLTKYSYNCIVYFASKKITDKNHESYLKSILSSMRPAKLIIASTFMEQDSIFDEDDYPDETTVVTMNGRRRKELKKLIKSIVSSDVHIILPEEEDIICIAKASKKRCGNAAVKIYEKQYDYLRAAFERGVEISTKKISIGVNEGAVYLRPIDSIDKKIGLIVNQLSNYINSEFTNMRSYSSEIHHWTLDAMLWNISRGNNYHSNAKVWRNINVLTFTKLEEICMDSIGEFCFSEEVTISRKEDVERVKSLFEANLRTELYYVVRKLILYKREDTYVASEYCETIKKLAFSSKYNKWGIIEDFRLCLMSAVTQPDYLQELLHKAIDHALIRTYDQICY